MQWIANYGTLQIIQSDQGTHFTGKLTQKLARIYDIQWEFHHAYNPTAARAIERLNGLLKLKLTQYNKEPLSKALLLDLIDLNNRPRMNRLSPIAEVVKSMPDIDYPDTLDKELIRPYICVHRNRKNNSLTRAEIVAEAKNNNLWITQGKGDLKQVKREDIA